MHAFGDYKCVSRDHYYISVEYCGMDVLGLKNPIDEIEQLMNEQVKDGHEEMVEERVGFELDASQFGYNPDHKILNRFTREVVPMSTSEENRKTYYMNNIQNAHIHASKFGILKPSMASLIANRWHPEEIPFVVKVSIIQG